MSQDKSSYRQIFKATSLFGGVQVFNIIISIVRSKAIAVLLGPVGMGISGMLLSTVTLISSLTSFGLGVSGVKDVAAAYEVGDARKVSYTAAILNKLIWWTGIFGVAAMLSLSPILSKITFDTYEYTWSFILLSVTLFLGQVVLGKNAILQGTRKLKWLAYANVLSSVIALIATLPLYYFFGVAGIVPAMIIISLVTFVVTQVFYVKLRFDLPIIESSETWLKGKAMMKLGFFLSLSGLIVSGCAYLVRLFISRSGTLEDIGFYNAGFGIVNSYVGIVLTAMATDYYPRLSGVISDKKSYIETVNQQGNVALLILGPIITIFVVACNYIITLLYSEEFLPISDMMRYAIIGIFFRAASWLLGYILLAKGSSKLFFGCELIANIYMTLLNCICFYYWGLTGLGISFIVGYILYLAQMLIVTHKYFGFRFSKDFVRLFIIQLTIALVALWGVNSSFSMTKDYIVGAGVIILSSIISLVGINKIIDLKQLFNSIKK